MLVAYRKFMANMWGF